MSGAEIFIAGLFVTALVGTAMGLLIWGFVMDARRRGDSLYGSPGAGTAQDEQA